MTVLALKGSRIANGVSEKHGEVSRAMWAELDGSGRAPIGHITNGVHAPSWIGADIQDLLDRHLGRSWRRELWNGRLLGGVFDIPAGDLWEAHNRQKRRLVEFVASRTGRRIPTDALVIGFARRFAPYKRGDMVLSHPDRLAALLGDPERPLVLLYSGKAHPRDEDGKSIIRNVVQRSGLPELDGHVLFIEDYDIGVGRALVQGVDLWLNNPRRPLEASGTSGQKVSMNGGLNCSTLDGWWLEGFAQEPRAGWAVGAPEPSEDVAAGDAADTDALYETLVEEIVPLFWQRDGDGLPSDWVHRMTAAIAVCLPAFNTDRMVADYVNRSYRARR
jgi:starch phosphorylase